MQVDWTAIALALIGVFGSLAGSAVAFYLHRMSNQVRQVQATNEAVVKSNKEIHSTVNSNLEKLQLELRATRSELLDSALQLSRASAEIATLTEQRRGAEAQAVKDESQKAQRDTPAAVAITTPEVNIVAPTPEINVEGKP